jgi:predicted protein tyrosine phosphatase
MRLAVPDTLQHILFICSLNRCVECTSAGLNQGADNPLTPEAIDWADLIFVMERAHKTKLSKAFKPYLGAKRVVCLDIPDNYKFMDPALIKLLRTKVTGFLGSA